MKRTVLLFCGLSCAAFVTAQDYQRTDYGIKATVDAVDVEVQFFTPSMVRVVKSPHGESFRKRWVSKSAPRTVPS